MNNEPSSITVREYRVSMAGQHFIIDNETQMMRYVSAARDSGQTPEVMSRETTVSHTAWGVHIVDGS